MIIPQVKCGVEMAVIHARRARCLELAPSREFLVVITDHRVL